MERERREKADAAEREYQRKYPVADSQLPSEPPLEPPLAPRPTGATPQLGALPASACLRLGVGVGAGLPLAQP